ncbi:MAG: DUF4440 domain-containing protein [bacterium]|nr:DUF4440 domain-containing protein [bacterium]
MIESEILNLEKELLKPEVRKDKNRIKELLSEDFVEFCSSGFIYKYKNNDVFSRSSTENWKIVDFKLKQLSENVYLALYKIIKHNEKKNSLRSSVWKKIDNKWKLIFHQGTQEIISEKEIL